MRNNINLGLCAVSYACAPPTSDKGAAVDATDGLQTEARLGTL